MFWSQVSNVILFVLIKIYNTITVFQCYVVAWKINKWKNEINESECMIIINGGLSYLLQTIYKHSERDFAARSHCKMLQDSWNTVAQ